MPSPLYIYVLNKGFVNILLITFLNEPKLIFCPQLNGFKHLIQQL